MADDKVSDARNLEPHAKLNEPHAKLNGFKLDYAASKQNGLDCWFIATLNGLRDKGGAPAERLRDQATTIQDARLAGRACGRVQTLR